MDDEPNLYIGNGWKSRNIHFFMVVWGSRYVSSLEGIPFCCFFFFPVALALFFSDVCFESFRRLVLLQLANTWTCVHDSLPKNIETENGESWNLNTMCFGDDWTA